jgi:hypothetical protein
MVVQAICSIFRFSYRTIQKTKLSEMELVKIIHSEKQCGDFLYGYPNQIDNRQLQITSGNGT